MDKVYSYDEEGAKKLLKDENKVERIIMAIVVPIILVVISIKDISEGKEFNLIKTLIIGIVLIIGMTAYAYIESMKIKKKYKEYKITVKDFEIIYECVGEVDAIDGQKVENEIITIRSISNFNRNNSEITIYGDITRKRYVLNKELKEKTIKEVTVPKFFSDFEEFVELVESRKLLI